MTSSGYIAGASAHDPLAISVAGASPSRNAVEDCVFAAACRAVGAEDLCAIVGGCGGRGFTRALSRVGAVGSDMYGRSNLARLGTKMRHTEMRAFQRRYASYWRVC